ncbi:hypothetical protein CPB84DRAFT_1820076 [Gymnopilus junonius]|uniref:Uncharacterized protein n=1 Tax=Gymnopilus junonius TaxID=109634 RepID=A0A9P5TUG2_GYMJU|nr:hypothetical protein CPB84DRAFT_1820076 [Gymnopilus junonius]
MPSTTSLTRSINILHGVSLCVAIMILALAYQDCGILSLCLNPIFAIMAMGYDTTMLLLAYKRPEGAPRLSIGYTVAAYLLSAAWLSAFVAMSAVLSSLEAQVELFDFRILVPQTMRGPQHIQILLDALECVLMGDIAVRSTIDRRLQREESEKVTPDC